MAMNTHRQLGMNQMNGAKSLEKLSSGLRINRAGDDAAGLAISEKMRGQIRGLNQATRNAQDGISMIQTAEGALNETHSILQRMRELAVQAANDTNTSEDRGEIQKELDQLVGEVNRISSSTEFNTQKLLDGTQDTIVNFDNIGGDDGDFTGLNFNSGSGLTDGSHTINVDYTAGMTASTFDSATDTATADGGNTATGDITLDGAYTGTADANLTISYSASTEFTNESMDDTGTTMTGTAVVDGTYSGSENTLTVEYHEATQSTLSGTLDNTQLTVDAGTTVEFVVGGETFTLDNTDLGSVWDGTNTDGQIATALNALTIAGDGGTTDLSDIGTFSFDTGSLVFELNNGGATTVQFNINDGDTDTIAIQTAFGLTDGDSHTGTDAKFTVTDGANGTDDIAVGGSATYQGLTVDVSGISGDTNGDQWTLDLSPNVTAWTLNDGTSTQAISGDTITYNGVTIDKTAVTGEVDGDEWTVSLTAAVQEEIKAKLGATGSEVDISSDGGAVTLTDGDASIEVDFGTFNLGTTNTTKAITVDSTTVDNSASIQIGSNQGQSMSVNISDMSANALNVNAINLNTQAGADAAITTIDGAIESVSTERSKLGAFQNRLEHTINNLGTASENLQAAESRIRDVDMAAEMMEFTKTNILQQAATAMLAQANQAPQSVLQLLG